MVPFADVTELMRPQLEKAWDDAWKKAKRKYNANSQRPEARRSFP